MFTKLATFHWQITILSRNNGSKSVVKLVCMRVFNFQRNEAGMKPTVNRAGLKCFTGKKKHICRTIKETPRCTHPRAGMCSVLLKLDILCLFSKHTASSVEQAAYSCSVIHLLASATGVTLMLITWAVER